MTTFRKAVRTAYSLSTLNWITAFFTIAFHALAIAALLFFSWTNFFVALALHWMAVGFGISLGYHRLHTHRGFKCSKAFEYFLAICGTMTLEGGPICSFWVATHRQDTIRTLGSGGRSAQPARRRPLGAHGLDSVRRHPPQQHPS